MESLRLQVTEDQIALEAKLADTRELEAHTATLTSGSPSACWSRCGRDIAPLPIKKNGT